MQSDAENTQALDFERIRILYDNFIRYGYGGIVAGGAFLYFTASRYSDPTLAFYWVLLVIVTNIPRLVVTTQFTRKMTAGLLTKENIQPWEHYLTIPSGLAYIGFIAVIFLPYGENSDIGIMACAFIFMIMATGGVLMLSTSLPAILLYMTLITASIFSRLLTLEDALFTIAAAIVVIGYIQIVRLIIRQNQILVENIALKIQNNQLALTDPLTKLWNRRRLDLYVDKLVPHSRRSGVPFSLIMLDIDHFKRYNDIHGHAGGDELLIRIADMLVTCSREQDLTVRYGGEEFLMVLPQTTINEAEVIAKRICTTVKKRTDVTISAGLAEFTDPLSFEQTLSQADEALYAAKKGGRDRYVITSNARRVD